MKLDILLFDFVFYYPLFMAYMWMIGGIAYYLRWERKSLQVSDPLAQLGTTPLVSVIVPCYNEEDNVREVVAALSDLNYPNYEIICVNDGSKDNTGAILDELTAVYPRLRVVHQATNQGKAVGLNTATLVARGEFLLCIDGDAVLDRDVIAWMLRHFMEGHRVGAVTGNPRIRTRSTLLGRLQVGEFSSIVGLIKRTQRIYGRVFTVSGVVAMFRKRALFQIGLWSPDMLTEDIDISWKLQTNHWDVRFEPRALCWILMPETLRGLWKQRLRWAMGGMQVICKFFHVLSTWRLRRMVIVYFEYAISVFWAYAMALVLIGLVRGPLRRDAVTLADHDRARLAWCADRHDLPGPDPRQHVPGQAIRSPDFPQFLLDDLVSAGILDAQYVHDGLGRAQGAAAPARQASDLDQP